MTRKTKEGMRCLTTYSSWKDIFDRFLALLMLAILSPFLVLIALLIRLESPGNPIFCQERVGKNGRKFNLYKFRSMYKDHDDSKYQLYISKYIQENLSTVLDTQGKDIYELINDPRVTRVGALLRRSNLDELPQLINVLKGDMSFVGPRPDLPFAVAMYQKHHQKRLLAKPGITGLWQILPTRRQISFDEVVQLDVEYISRQSLYLDIKIMILTALDIISFNRRQKESRELNMSKAIKS